MYLISYMFSSFFFNDTASTEIYTLSLHDALPISVVLRHHAGVALDDRPRAGPRGRGGDLRIVLGHRSEEHTSELQSPVHLVCRLLLEKKKFENSRARGKNVCLLSG